MVSEPYRTRMIFANEKLALEFIKRENLVHYYLGPWSEKGEFVVYYNNENKSDNVNHPAHYTSGGIECIDGMVAAFGREYVMHYCLCNAFKYIWRCEHKGKRVEDIRKAVWYLNKWQSLAEEEAMIDAG